MKLTKVLIIVIFTFQVSNIFAGNTEPKSVSSSDFTSSPVLTLAPTTPIEATFEDDATLTDFAGLAPVTPVEADFSDVVPEQNIEMTKLAPVTPVEADFFDTL